MSHDDYKYCEEKGHRFADSMTGSGVDYACCANCLAVRIIQSWVGQVDGEWKVLTVEPVIIEDPRIRGARHTATDLPSSRS